MDSGEPGAELLLVIEQFVRFLRQVSVADGISHSASSLLSRLLREGPRRLTELAVAESVSQPGMTQLVTRLEREGLVRRTASAGDRRGVLVEITEAGTELVRHRRAERTTVLQRMIADLAPEDREAVVAALPALTRLVTARRPDPAHSQQGEKHT